MKIVVIGGTGLIGGAGRIENDTAFGESTSEK
jgi:hypothetical protein